MTIRIIQKDTWSCFACVAAMITGETAEDVFKFIGHDGSGFDPESQHPEKRAAFDYVEIIKYLINYRYSIGTWSNFDEPLKISNYSEIHTEIVIEGNPAILSVPSEKLGGECTHVVYWDGKNIFDPSPDAKDNPKLSDYKVLKFIPVLYFEP